MSLGSRLSLYPPQCQTKRRHLIKEQQVINGSEMLAGINYQQVENTY